MSNKSFKGILLFLCFLMVFFCLMAVALREMQVAKNEKDPKPTLSIGVIADENGAPATEGIVIGDAEPTISHKDQPTLAESKLLLKHYAVGIITAIFLILAVVVAIISKRKDMNELTDNQIK